jgi:hypothetical protein
MSNSGECQKYNVPPHLENLFSEATRERPNYEKEAIAKLLCKVKTIFCRKGSFGNIQWAYGNLMVPAGQIKGRK